MVRTQAEKPRPDPMELARPRAIEHMSPGSWWLHDYTDGDGKPAQVWVQVVTRLSLTSHLSGTRAEKLEGMDTDGDWCVLAQLRGFGIPKTLRAAEGRRCGLEQGSTPETENGDQQ